MLCVYLMYNHKISTNRVSLVMLGCLSLLLAIQAKAQEEIVVTGKRLPSPHTQALTVLHESLARSHSEVKEALRRNLNVIKSVRKSTSYRACVRSNQGCLEALDEISSGFENRTLMIPEIPNKALMLKGATALSKMTAEERQVYASLEAVRAQIYGQPFANKNDRHPEIAECLNTFGRWRIQLITQLRDLDDASNSSPLVPTESQTQLRREYKNSSLLLFKCYHLEVKFLADPVRATGAQIGDFLNRTEAMNRADLRRLRNFQP